MKRRWVLVLLVVVTSLLIVHQDLVAKVLSVRTNRWLEVRQVVGTATYYRGRQSPQLARIGTRLQAVGDTLKTNPQSSLVLAVDTGIGFVNVAENTTIRVQQLQAIADGGRVTRLEVSGGQARLRVRPFTRPSSRLEIRTPAGLSGVRGTEFGVSVQPDGKTGVATLEGRVVAEAQGQAVDVGAKFQSLIVPGEPPSPPTPLTEDTRLQLRLLTTLGNRRARIAGQVDPVNLLLIAETPQTLNRSGEFDITVPLPDNQRIQAVVITPLGKRQVYELAVP